MPRLSAENVARAHEIIGRYPVPRSALIPLLHLAQEQDGHLTEEAMAHIADLIGHTPAEVIGVATFYEMFKHEPVGRYLVNICTNISCMLMGGEELLAHAEQSLGIKAGGTTPDGKITLEDTECLAACTEAPMCQVNYRYFYKLTPQTFDTLIADVRSGKLDGDIPPHGTLQRVRQSIPTDRRAGIGIMPGGGEPPAGWADDQPALRES
jgi:NADH-quinone oxidoreductase subunit E